MYFIKVLFAQQKCGPKPCTKGCIKNKFAAEGRTEWKSKVKKVITTADVLFYSKSSEKRKGYHVRTCPIFHAISVKNKVYISVSARGPHEMISRAVVCPPLV